MPPYCKQYWHALWYNPLLPLLFWMSALFTGISIIILEAIMVHRYMGQPDESELLEILTSILPWLLGGYQTVKLPAIQQSLLSGRRRIVSFFPHLRVHTFTSDHVSTIDRDFSPFSNINTPADYYELRKNDNKFHESTYPAYKTFTS